VPGMGLAFAGRPALGAAMAVLAAGVAVVALFLLPGWIAPILLHGSWRSVQALLGILWLGVLVTAHLQREGEK